MRIGSEKIWNIKELRPVSRHDVDAKRRVLMIRNATYNVIVSRTCSLGLKIGVGLQPVMIVAQNVIFQPLCSLRPLSFGYES